jgi:ABC-type dipeptide/oligopeptide/nickel transport system permease component
MWPSLAITLPSFLIGLAVCLTFALIFAFFRATYVDFLGVVLCVTAMSISGLFYIIGGQWLISKLWHLVPISGFGYGFDIWRFAILPIGIGVLSGTGGAIRLYRTLFLEEINKDYVRTARAKGMSGARAVPPCLAQRPHSGVDRCCGRYPEPVHRQPDLRVVLRDPRAGQLHHRRDPAT